jgi:hypothetical protein
MKAKLEFNLPEDQSEFQCALQGSNWKHVCWKLNEWLRGNVKHAPDSVDEKTLQAYRETREQLLQLMLNHGVDFE